MNSCRWIAKAFVVPTRIHGYSGFLVSTDLHSLYSKGFVLSPNMVRARPCRTVLSLFVVFREARKIRALVISSRKPAAIAPHSAARNFRKPDPPVGSNSRTTASRLAAACCALNSLTSTSKRNVGFLRGGT